MRMQIYFKNTGLADVELDDELIGINLDNPDKFVEEYLKAKIFKKSVS